MLHKQLAVALFFVFIFFGGIAQNFEIKQLKIADNKNLWLKKNTNNENKVIGNDQIMDIFYPQADFKSDIFTYGIDWRINNEFLPGEYVYVRDENNIIVDSTTLKLKNAIVNFNWLNNSFNNDSPTYSYNSLKPVKLDTIFFSYAHINRSGMPNYIRTRIVNVNAQTRIPNLINEPVWENIVTTDTSLLRNLMILPVTEEILFEEPFAVVVDFYGGDKIDDEFYIFCSYNKTCSEYYTLAEKSKFYPNSFYTLSANINSELIVSLLPSTNNELGVDINGNGVLGESEFCEAFYIQNWHIGATVSFKANLTGNIVVNADTLCRGDILTLNAVANFGTPPYSFLWQSKDGSPLSTQKKFDLLPQINETYTLRITDSLDNAILIEKDITVNRLRLTMPEDLNLTCGATTEIEPAVNSTSDNVVYSWINGNTEPAITAFPGNYSLTVTDGYCVETGSVNIGIETDITANFEETVSNELSVDFNNLSTNATSYFWDFGDGNISNEENPFHTYTNKDNYIVSLNAVNGNCSITKFKTINLNDFPVNIKNEPLINNKVSISPNPSSTGQFWVTLQLNPNNKVYSYTIFDSTGKTLFNKKEAIVNQQTQFSLNLENIPTGTYFLQIYDGHSTIIKKLLRMR